MNLLPDFSSNQWIKHSPNRINVTGMNEVVINANAQWHVVDIIISVQANTNYHFKVDNPNNGSVFIFERNNGKETYLAGSSDLEFTTKNNTDSLRIGVSNGVISTGSYLFKNSLLELVNTNNELLPELSNSQWVNNSPSQISISAQNEITIQPKAQWHVYDIILAVQPSRTYSLSVENLNNGTVFIFERDQSNKEQFLAISSTIEFETKSTTKSLRIGLSNGTISSGEFLFRNASLVDKVGDSTPPPPPNNELFSHGDLKVSSNGHYLVHQDETPFFFMADTSWELFARATREQVETYLLNRKQKGFNVIQAVVVSQFERFNVAPNIYGEKPILNNNFYQPNEAYYQNVDWIVNKAEEIGLYIAMLPIWGSAELEGPARGFPNPMLNPGTNNQGLQEAENKAYFHGNLLGNRYKNKPNIIWMLGGDTDPVKPGVYDFISIYRAMANGIVDADGGRLLRTYHSAGSPTSRFLQTTTLANGEKMIDFNTIQTTSVFDFPNYVPVYNDWKLTPATPTLNAENRYEDSPNNYTAGNPRLTDFDVRQAQYWALFSGAFGITYGHNDIWQMYVSGLYPSWTGANTNWYDELDSPGAFHMSYLKKLMISRPILSRIPDQAIIASSQPSTAGAYIVATRSSDGSYAFVYSPYGGTVSINMNKISGGSVKAQWYNPRNGSITLIGIYTNTGTRNFTAPSSGRGNDWILILDDNSKNFPTP
ncbi:glycoside hydrolase family 140 protein [Guptibacillus hwajinpoensis]|uniref:glycoside hydrolase family 140 protein n=1 Tax=Guptibacillus hwajinpoensis TaxID=208199 RepID=UPI003D01F3C0